MQACQNNADCAQILADAGGSWPDRDTCYANTECGVLYDCAMATIPCSSEDAACRADSACAILLDANPYDDSACMSNSLCATYQNCMGVYHASVAAGTPAPYTNGDTQTIRLGHYSSDECNDGFSTDSASGISCRCPYNYQHTTVEDLHKFCVCEKVCTRQ
eukprot:COSAG06_NODE_7720_length_2400_cov_1.728814_2_plen_161_part_00